MPQWGAGLVRQSLKATYNEGSWGEESLIMLE